MENLLVPYHATECLPGTRILVLAPHPDDEVFGCGGALALHAARQATITVVIATDGAFHAEPEKTETMRAMRCGESNAAAVVLGYPEPRYLNLPDRGLQYGEALIATLIGLIQETDADLIYAPSVYEAHPDHRGLAMATAEAVRRVGGERSVAFYEVGRPLQPTHLVDITPVLSRKAEAMACFPSQLLKQRYDQHVAALNRYRTYTLPEEVAAAEAFQVVHASALNGGLGLYRSEYQKQQALGLPVDPADLPLVSVLIRSMNRDNLANALDSVALQTYPNIEVVVVNASGAEHRSLGEFCGRFPLRLVEPGKPLGRSAAANAALDAGRGDLLTFLDDDDHFLPSHIAALKGVLDTDGPATIAAYAGVSCVDGDGKEFHRYQRAFDKFAFSVENFIPIHAVLFRRKAVEGGARFDEQLKHLEDWDFWLQVQDHGTFRLLPEVSAIYRVVKGEGSGLWGNYDLARPAMLHIYRKRLPHWSDEALWKLFELTRFKPLYEKAHGELAQANERIATLERELNHAKQQFEASQTNLKNRETELVGVIATRDGELAAMRGSLSWRITEPLRALKSSLRGKK